MESKLYSVEKVKELILEGKLLSLAGDEKLLSQLPKGNWIAGTIPYFMDTEKGLFSNDKIFVNVLSNFDNNFKIKTYNCDSIFNIAKDSYENGYTILIIPPFQKILQLYALQARKIKGLYTNPITGWVAGNELESNDIPKVFNGSISESYIDQAVAIHVKLPKEKFAILEVTNIFEIDEDSDIIQFFEDDFECEECLVNGNTTNLHEYIKKNNIDIKYPLVTNFFGVNSNIGFKEVKNGKVSFFAPFFKDKLYKFSKHFSNYIDEFEQKIDNTNNNIDFSCNCILNYLYGNLENKKIKNVTGPITFGEISYLLLNQTLVNLIIDDY